MNLRAAVILLCAACALFDAPVAQAQSYYPLQVILPREGGTAPDPGQPTLSPDHFTLWAYPGVTYRMRAAVIGGHYPYVYALSGAPAGMTIEPATGVISWPDPRADSGPITLQVTDSDGMTIESTWTIRVDADKFRFLDCDAAGAGAGTIDDPLQNLSDIPRDSSYVGKILYFRECSAPERYNALDLPRAGGGGDRVEWNACCHPQQWLAYPGESPVIDLGYEEGGEVGTAIRFQGSPAALVGFESIRGRYKHFNIISNVHYAVFWGNRMHQLAGIDGVNAAFIMSETSVDGPSAAYNVFQSNELYDWGAVYGGLSGACMKIYSQYKLLIEDSVCRDAVGSDEIEGIALKGGIMERATVRNNVVHGVAAHALGGNHHTLVSAEFLHNRVYDCSSSCAFFNQDGLIDSTISVYRNTFVGPVQIDHVGSQAGALFQFCNNVHVTDDPLDDVFPGTRFRGYDATDPSQVDVCDAPGEDIVRVPADGCVDATGLLSDDGDEDCRSMYLGMKGAEIAGGGPVPGVDGGVTADGGVTPGTDGGTPAGDDGAVPGRDGGTVDPGDADGGCGCRVGSRRGPTALGAFAALALLAAARGRRSRHGGGKRSTSLTCVATPRPKASSAPEPKNPSAQRV